MPQDWYKRRNKPVEDMILGFEVIGFKKVEDTYCKMKVTFEDLGEVELDAFIQYYPKYNKWTVHGMNEKGISVLARLVE